MGQKAGNSQFGAAHAPLGNNAEDMVSSGYNESEAMALFEGQRVSGFVQEPYTAKGIAEKVKACLG